MSDICDDEANEQKNQTASNKTLVLYQAGNLMWSNNLDRCGVRIGFEQVQLPVANSEIIKVLKKKMSQSL
jgi:hypothetical protein